jgi:hypothetical protein
MTQAERALTTAAEYARTELGRRNAIAVDVVHGDDGREAMVLLRDGFEEFAIAIDREGDVFEDSLEAADFYRNGGARGEAVER